MLAATDRRLAGQAAELLRGELQHRPVELARGELPLERLNFEALAVELSRSVDERRKQYDRTFGLLVPRECPPYETEYHPSGDASFRSQQLADVAGFYRAFGLQSSSRRPERPDHIGLELEFMALVLMKKRMAQQQSGHSAAERARLCEDAERKFFAEHLAWWAPAFAAGLRRKAGAGLYAGVADVLAAFIAAERQYLEVPPSAQQASPMLIETAEEQAGCAACPLRT
jgi:TorA maturation chaperone TorD